MNQYYNPVRTYEGEGALSHLPDVIQSALPNGGHILLLCYAAPVLEHPIFRSLLDQSALPDTYETNSLIFSASNPTIEQLFSVFCSLREQKTDLIIAVGGGSVLDVGKTLCLLGGMELQSADELRSVIAEKHYQHPVQKWIGIPTTAGTGSEVTCWATIWDPEQEAKRSAESKENFAYAAIVDASLAKGMPIALAVSSGLDAAAHALESYWANASNLVSRALALKSMETVMQHMDALLAGDPKAHEAMAQGSMLAGLAFSNTKTTACHSISYPLTMEYHIPHGAAVSLLMGPVLKLNEAAIHDKKALFAALGIQTADELGLKISSILQKAGIPASLRGWNVPREALPELAAHGITKGRADNNPVPLTKEKILFLLEGIYETQA